MKNAIIFLLGCVIVAGAIVYATHQKSAPTPAPVVADNSSAPAAPAVSSALPATPAPTPSVSTPAATVPAPAMSTITTPAPAKSDADIAFGKLMDSLLSTNINGLDKHNLFQQLIKNGQLDQAIAALQQRAAADPTNPEIPTTLGEAQLNKVRILKESGADVTDLGILAMQADQSFNAALKLDPDNYEAQLMISVSHTYWPPDPTRDAQVVQTLSGLIDRQDSMSPGSGSSQPYIYLAKEYQKIGEPDKAQATVKLGMQKFPNDSTLQQMSAGGITQ